MIDYPIEMHCCMDDYYKHSSYHVFVLDFHIYYPEETRMVIVLHPISRKHNLYVIDYPCECMHYRDVDEFVLYLTPASLKVAQKAFSWMKFTKENYYFD
jgi:hypothetical protein